jgi:hypothetical protein
MTIEPVVPVPDEFGRTPAIFGYETDEIRTRFNDDCGYERWFDDRKEAFAFYGRAVNNKTNGPSPAGRLTNIKIDSIWSYPDTLKRQDVIVVDPEWLMDTIKLRDFDLRVSDFRSPREMAADLPDSTIIGFSFITYERVDCKSLYSVYNAEYVFLDKLAKADRLIKGYEHIENLFTWVHCKENDVRCLNEQFMREVVDTNPWTTRADYKYIRYEPIYYVDFKRGYLSSVVDLN